MVFRKWSNGDILALMPEIPADNYGYMCQSYEIVGEHGGADYTGCISQTKPATKAEYKDCYTALKRRGYNIRVVKRASSRHHETCRKEARGS